MIGFAENNKLQLLIEKAESLKFDDIGVAEPKLDLVRNKFEQWLEQGFNGEMAYMKRWRDKRLDLNQVLPGVKSVLCLRTNYFTQPRGLEFLEDSQTGDISHYALNQDYHDVIKPRLKELENTLSELFPGCQSKSYVDTGPILEKPLAQQAGLGWIGKHTNLLTEGVGSWYFLAVILTDAELPISDPGVDHCGTCISCIEICPTQAIVAPYVLDSRRCISYLTIELKGPIPREFRKPIGNRIYGCDDCQIVCPWNSFAVPTEDSAFQEKQGTRLLIELMQLDDVGFRERFRKSPIKRIKRRGLLRNVAVALGNSGDLEAVPVLTKALRDEEPLIRAHAVWALTQILGKEANTIFRNHLPNETNPWVLEEIQISCKTE